MQPQSTGHVRGARIAYALIICCFSNNKGHLLFVVRRVRRVGEWLSIIEADVCRQRRPHTDTQIRLPYLPIDWIIGVSVRPKLLVARGTAGIIRPEPA